MWPSMTRCSYRVSTQHNKTHLAGHTPGRWTPATTTWSVSYVFLCRVQNAIARLLCTGHKWTPMSSSRLLPENVLGSGKIAVSSTLLTFWWQKSINLAYRISRHNLDFGPRPYPIVLHYCTRIQLPWHFVGTISMLFSVHKILYRGLSQVPHWARHSLTYICGHRTQHPNRRRRNFWRPHRFTLILCRSCWRGSSQRKASIVKFCYVLFTFRPLNMENTLFLGENVFRTESHFKFSRSSWPI